MNKRIEQEATIHTSYADPYLQQKLEEARKQLGVSWVLHQDYKRSNYPKHQKQSFDY